MVTDTELEAARLAGFRAIGMGISDCPYTRTGLSPMSDRDKALADAWISGLAQAEDEREQELLEGSNQQHNDLRDAPDLLPPAPGACPDFGSKMKRASLRNMRRGSSWVDSSNKRQDRQQFNLDMGLFGKESATKWWALNRQSGRCERAEWAPCIWSKAPNWAVKVKVCGGTAIYLDEKEERCLAYHFGGVIAAIETCDLRLDLGVIPVLLRRPGSAVVPHQHEGLTPTERVVILIAASALIVASSLIG